MHLTVNTARLVAELNALAAISDCPEPPPAVTRIVFTPTDLRARDFLASLYCTAGLAVRTDAIGNVFARWEGSDPSAAVVGTGSHCDALPHAGMYDGTVGVLGGLEAIRTLQAAGFKPRRSIELVMITSEEPTRFGLGCLGSRAMAGALGDVSRLVDDAGDSLEVVCHRAGFTGLLESTKLPPGYHHAWVELHIEQGPELEAKNLLIGVVTGIAAPLQAELTIHGEGGHAGAVLMPRRHDALNAAAEMISAIERLATSSPSADLVATVGRLDVHPGAANSIPSRVKFSLDLRDIDGANRDRVFAAIETELTTIANRRGVTWVNSINNADPPAPADPLVMSAIKSACQELGHAYQQMPSRAYHDSLFMARIAPMGMIFIPCRAGVSHRPDEYSSPEQLTAGVEVLAQTLANLAS